ncbi:NUDIX hydrolase [Marinoscillum furvescens]|uniref:ADP-ribose pyrophosphatase YjhB (NUDIX family) n=1 Tax=Marinoscillum furvescens DSM 4134 TaxID=1122208 RepID=A0A3D9L4B8_MARFU|nr:NUDIX hydrolase [Marinoscillum furvescens]REE00422.1 ADP-ribose pyrophosphatase YjhB (NUDIX family) [Marinoscillum furvescens DSM 4134]
MDSKEVLEFLKRVQAMAKTGLSYTENPYDVERYEELRDTSNALLAKWSESDEKEVRFFFDQLDTYPTPKIDVRGLVMQEGKVLMIREKVDGKWAMPGGWCDIGYTPSENIRKEIFEESGLEVKVSRLLSVWDKKMHDHPPEAAYVYKLSFLCEITGGALVPGHETLGADFFDVDDLPELSLPRNTEDQVRRLVELANKEGLDFD